MNNTPDEYINNSKNEASSIGREKDGLICPVKKLVNPVSRIPKNETVQSCEEKTLINPVSRILKKKDSEHCNSSFALKLKENKTTGNMVLHTMMFPQMHEDTTMTKLESKDFRVDNYVFHNSGLYFIDETMRETKISNFWVEIITEKNYINLLGDAKSNVIDTEVSVKWKVRIFCANRWFEGEVSRDELQNEKRLLALTRDRAVLESSNQTKNLYCKYIGKLIEQENFNLENVYATSGWVYRQDMGWIYLTDKGAIGIPGCNCYTDVPYTFNYISLAVGTKEIFQDFWNLRFICSNRMENSIFLMHFSCLATITTFFQLCGHGINFVVAMVGETNSFKTSCAKVFTRMFNRNESSGVDIRFNSSEVAITEEMERYGDAIMTVDDYIPYESKQELNIQKKKLDTIIRSFGDREARKRSEVYAKINGVPTFTPIRGCCLMTGETIDFSSESSATRVVQLAFEQGQVDLELLTYYQKNSLILPTFLCDFIGYIRQHIQDVMNIITTEVDKVRNNCHRISTPRFRETLGIMSAAATIFYQYARDRGFFSAEDSSRYFQEDMAMIEKIIIKNDGETKIKSPASLICLSLETAIREGSFFVITEDDAAVRTEFTNTVVDAGEFLYILPDTLFGAYLRYCRGVGRELIYKCGRELNAPLKKDKVILVKEEGSYQRSTHKIKSKTSQRFLYLRKTKIKELTDVFNNF